MVSEALLRPWTLLRATSGLWTSRTTGEASLSRTLCSLPSMVSPRACLCRWSEVPQRSSLLHRNDLRNLRLRQCQSSHRHSYWRTRHCIRLRLRSRRLQFWSHWKWYFTTFAKPNGGVIKRNAGTPNGQKGSSQTLNYNATNSLIARPTADGNYQLI